MTGTAPANRVPIASVLTAMGAELGALGSLIDRVQDALSPALSPAVLADPGVLASLQQLDRLAQTVRALAGVAARLSDAAGPSATADPAALLGAIPLADLARRLGAPTHPAAEDEDNGFTIALVMEA